MTKIALNSVTKLQMRIQGLKGVIDSHKRSGRRGTVIALRGDLEELEKQLEIAKTQNHKDDRVRFLGGLWIRS